MSNPINLSKTHRTVLLIDLNPLLHHSPNNYISTILTTSRILLLSSSSFTPLCSFKLFFSSLSPLLSASTLRRLLPHHPSSSLSFNSPSHTLASLSQALASISVSQLPQSTSSSSAPSNCLHTAAALVKLVKDYDGWESDIDSVDGVSGTLDCRDGIVGVCSNLVVLLSPVCHSVEAFGEFVGGDGSLDGNLDGNLDGCRGKFRECFGGVSEAFNGKDIQFCWVDVRSYEEGLEVKEIEKDCVCMGNDIRKFGWGFCSSDSVILGSALVSFGLVYPNIVVSSKLLECCRVGDKIRGHLNLEILDVSGKPLECKCCDLELLHMKGSSKARFNDTEVGTSKAQNLDIVNKFLGSLNDGIVKLNVTAVQKCNEYVYNESVSSDFFIVQSAEESGKKGKDGLDNLFTDRVLELLAGDNSVLFEKTSVPTWQIFLSFLYREGYWASLSLSTSSGDTFTGILRPFTINSAVLLLLDDDHSLTPNPGGTNLSTSENIKRRKMKKHAYQDLTWSSFYKAAYEFTDVDLAEVYFANGLNKSKKLKFLKCWIKEVKTRRSSLNKMPSRLRQRDPDLNQQKETDINESSAASCQENNELLAMHTCSDQPGMQDGPALESCSETLESFFSSLPRKVQHGLQSDGVDLKILAERLVNSSIYWLRVKHESIENVDESSTVQVTEIIKLLLREPKDLKEHKDDDPGSTSKYLVREYELQILLRLEILQSEYASSIKGSMKMKLVKQICSLLEIIQYLVEGGFHGDVSLYAYVERTIKARYKHNLGDIVDKIYDQMDLLPFGDENEDQAFMFNSEDSNQSWKEKHERNDMSISKMVQDSLSIDDDSSFQLEEVNKSHECKTKEDHARKLNEARERREKARRYVSCSSRMPDLQRVWAPKQLKPMKVKPEPKRKKPNSVNYSVVCETPMSRPSCATPQNRGERSNPVSKALFQDET